MTKQIQPYTILEEDDPNGFLPAGEYLVSVFPNGHVTLAFRAKRWQTWGPPIPATKAALPSD